MVKNRKNRWDYLTADLKDPRWIYAKGGLFLTLGILSASLLLWLVPSFRVAVLLLICIWSFCRFYYFAFYVIQYYVTPDFRFTGLLSVAKYLLSEQSSAKGIE